jgi:hypothetical protein
LQNRIDADPQVGVVPVRKAKARTPAAMRKVMIG